LAVAQSPLVVFLSPQILDVLEAFVHRWLKLKYMRLDGSTRVAERQDMLDEFTEDTTISVFLISTRAGGLGCACSHSMNCVDVP
jgi:SNF2 family DNA or RNA helicase